MISAAALRTASRPSADQFVGAMKLEHADLADLELHQGVRRIAGQPRAHDAVLENVESAHHRGHQARGRSIGVGVGAGPDGSAAPPTRDHAAAVAGGFVGRRRRLRAAERILNGRAAPDAVARNVERDDALGAERARDADRHRIDDRAVEQPASVDLDRLKYAGQRVGSADRLDQGAAPEPDLVPVADFGRDAGEPDRQILDLKPAERRLEPARAAARRR